VKRLKIKPNKSEKRFVLCFWEKFSKFWQKNGFGILTRLLQCAILLFKLVRKGTVVRKLKTNSGVDKTETRGYNPMLIGWKNQTNERRKNYDAEQFKYDHVVPGCPVACVLLGCFASGCTVGAGRTVSHGGCVELLFLLL